MSLTSYRAAPPRDGRLSEGACPRALSLGWIGRPGGDLLSRALRHSTMGAGEFHGRVRDGIGCRLPAIATRSSNPPWALRARGCDRGSGCVSPGETWGSATGPDPVMVACGPRIRCHLSRGTFGWRPMCRPGDDFHAWCLSCGLMPPDLIRR
jgi:hypothetical protein